MPKLTETVTLTVTKHEPDPLPNDAGMSSSMWLHIQLAQGPPPEWTATISAGQPGPIIVRFNDDDDPYTFHLADLIQAARSAKVALDEKRGA